MNKSILFFILIIMYFLNPRDSHSGEEDHYNQEYCKSVKGYPEVKLDDYTRVDCLNEEYAIETEMASKWKEAIGQSLHYADITKKKPFILLVIEWDSDIRHYHSLKRLISISGLDIKIGLRFGNKKQTRLKNVEDPQVKLSKSGKCHDKDKSQYYGMTLNFDSYDSMKDCENRNE